jgi:hypothetical protein
MSVEYARWDAEEEVASSDRRLTVVEPPTPGTAGGVLFQYLSGEVRGRSLDATLNEYGREGWQVRVCVPNKTPAGYPDGTFFIMLERKLSVPGRMAS